MSFNYRFSIIKFQNAISIFLLISILLLLVSCGQPILESSQCIESRDVVKRFYSIHLGNEMKPSPENLALRKEYLSDELVRILTEQTEENKDYFTQTDDYPKAFRVGGCEDVSPTKTKFETLVFWKTPTRSEQRALVVEAVNENSKWVVNKVESKN